MGQENGSLTSVVDPTLAAQALVALADGLQFQWLLDPDRTQMLKVFDTFYHLLLGITNGAHSVQPPDLLKD
jgi:hypothetical protein